MSNFQYMRIHKKDIPHKVIVVYSLLSITDLIGYGHVGISKEMYELKESGIITYKRLIKTSDLMATPL